MDGSAWLSETRRSLAAVGVAVVVVLIFALPRTDPDASRAQTIDNFVVCMSVYLLCYVMLTGVAFGRASTTTVRDWAQRSGRGSWLQRYVLGTAPGPGLAIFVGLIALLVAVLWLPSDDLTRSTLPGGARAALGVIVIVVSWTAVVVSFAVAYQAEDLQGHDTCLSFPGTDDIAWTDYLYFSLSIMTTLGATDVEVVSTNLRRTVAVHAILAFVFNTVILGAVVSALLG